jgi:hypothetical protein
MYFYDSDHRCSRLVDAHGRPAGGCGQQPRAESGIPRETTANRFFNECQFEAYRELGYGIAEQAIDAVSTLRELAVPANVRCAGAGTVLPGPNPVAAARAGAGLLVGSSPAAISAATCP